MTYKIFTVTAFAGLMFASCNKGPMEKPIVCDEEVIFSHQHFCSGYVLEREDGSFLRATEHKDGYQTLNKLFDGRKKGERLRIGFTRPAGEMDCTWEDSISSTRIRLGCAEWNGNRLKN